MRCRDSSSTQPCPSFCAEHLSLYFAMWYLPLVPHQLDYPVEFPEHSSVMLQPEFDEFDWEFMWFFYLGVRHRPQGCSYLAFCRIDPESLCDWPLWKLFDDIESERARFCFEKGVEEPRPTFREKSVGLAASFPLCHGCKLLSPRRACHPQPSPRNCVQMIRFLLRLVVVTAGWSSCCSPPRSASTPPLPGKNFPYIYFIYPPIAGPVRA